MMSLLGGCRAKAEKPVRMFPDTLFPPKGECSWRRWVGVWGQQMHGSTVPEASKLPVIFLMMQRSAHNHRESNLQCCSPRTGPAHRLTGCHNNPNSAPCLLEQNSGKPTATATLLVTTLSRGIRWVPGNSSVLVQVLGKQGSIHIITIHY